MPTESPRPGESSLGACPSDHPSGADQAHLLEELAQVEHELEALGRYREELRERLSEEEKVEHSKGRGTCAP